MPSALHGALTTAHVQALKFCALLLLLLILMQHSTTSGCC
jgi:hypothetical protein